MKNLAGFVSFLIFWGCGVSPTPINYGHDSCSFCRMTIVDQQHSAEVVTTKGKVFKYDAIECMMNDLRDWNRPEVSIYLVADYIQPGELVDATKAFYLVSEEIASPMGAFLTAFANPNERDDLIRNEDDEPFNWDTLKTKFEIP